MAIQQNFDDINILINTTTVENPIDWSYDSGHRLILNVFDSKNKLIQIPSSPTGAMIDIDPNESESGFNIIGTTLSLDPTKKLNQFYVSSGNYNLRFDFLQSLQSFINIGLDNSITDDNKFILTEVSPSRKEIRLVLDSSWNTVNISNPLIISALKGMENEDGSFSGAAASGTYNIFNHVIKLTDATKIPLVNVVYDSSNPSLILKLYKPLPTFVRLFDTVNIFRELLSSQNQEIVYVSNIVGQQSGTALDIDTSYLSEQSTVSYNDQFESYGQLIESASFSEEKLNIVNQEANNKDKNLNVDYSSFENHVFFGSAKQKLVNFKNKISDIELNLSEISTSLAQTSSNYIVERRKVLFENIDTIKQTFTSYEKFLYNDKQTTSEASAPGIQNLAFNDALSNYHNQEGAEGDTFSQELMNNSQNSFKSKLSSQDGFRAVTKYSNLSGTDSDNQTKIWPFLNYQVEEPPFFNYSGSLYLSFLLRGDPAFTGSFSSHLPIQNLNSTYDLKTNVKLPQVSFHSSSILTPVITQSNYNRFIYVTSQSYWETNKDLIDTFFTNANQAAFETDINFVVLSGSNITGSQNSEQHWPSGYQNFIESYNPDLLVTSSCLPMGFAFPIYLNNSLEASSETTSSFFTDVTISTTNPVDVLPFSTIVSTGSAAWNNWYDEQIVAASAYDEENIHSLKNNLPVYIQDDPESDELILFLQMLGEHYDLLRNYIDNFQKFNKKKYSNTENTSANLFSILGENFGWELINPYTSDLADYYGAIASGSNQSVNDIANETYKKILNNLIYIYKTKGTTNSIRGLLNSYGYAPDQITIQQFGGSIVESNPRIITNDIKDLKAGIGKKGGSVSFVNRTVPMHAADLGNDRSITLDWWTNNANADALEFVFSSKKTNTRQILAESSGSGAEKLWDLSIVPSASSDTIGKLEFRLSFQKIQTSSIASNSVSMSTSFMPLMNNNFQNVLLQRETSSLNSDITQSYKLHVGHQIKDRITEFSVASMSINSATTNVNFISGSTLATTASDNLIIGRTFSGSMAEIRTWKAPLQISKFKQHVLNKFSTVGNNVSSSRHDLIYRFRLNENYNTASINPKLKDANPNYNGDYSRTSTIGHHYNVRKIDTTKFTVRAGGIDQLNDNRIIVNPSTKFISDLSVTDVTSIQESDEKINEIKFDDKIEITNSPVDKINDFIINQMSDYDLGEFIGDPNDKYNYKYDELAKLRNKILKGVKLDTNKYIANQKGIFNNFLINSIQQLLPAKTKFETAGVVIKQDLLSRNKTKKFRPSITDKNIMFSGDLGKLYNITYTTSGSYNQNLYQNSNLDITNIYTLTGSRLNPYNTNKIDIFDVNDIDGLTIGMFDKNLPVNIDFTSSQVIVPYTSSLIDIKHDPKSVFIGSTNLSNFDDIVLYNQIKHDNSTLNNPYQTNTILNRLVVSQSSITNPFEQDISIRELYGFDSKLVKLFSYNTTYTTQNLLIEDVFNLDTSALINPISSTFVDVDYPKFITSSLLTPYQNNFKIDAIQTSLTSSILVPLLSSIVNVDPTVGGGDVNEPSLNYVSSTSDSKFGNCFVSDILTLTSSKISPFEKDLQYTDITYKTSGNYIASHEGTDNTIGSQFGYKQSKYPWQDIYGNDYNFINWMNEGASGDYNSDYYEKRQVFFAIGDNEFISGSYLAVSSSKIYVEPLTDHIQALEKFRVWNVDYNDFNIFHGRRFVDIDKNYSYNSYFGIGSDINKAPVKGRMIGRTAFYSSSNSSTGTQDLFYPSNHYINAKTSKTDMQRTFYEGTKNGVAAEGLDQNFNSRVVPIQLTKVHFPNNLDVQPDDAVYTIEVSDPNLVVLDADTVNKK